MRRTMLFAAFAAVSTVALALSREAEEFIAISKTLEPVQCEKRKLRREILLAETERRDADAKALRSRLAELGPRLERSSDPQDLEAISRASREAFYRCE